MIMGGRMHPWTLNGALGAARITQLNWNISDVIHLHDFGFKNVTLPETNSSPLKIDEDGFISFWDLAYFQGANC